MKKTICSLVSIMLLAGCSSTVSPASVRTKSALALGLQEHEFTLSNRQDNASDIEYDLKLNKGATYHCTMRYSVFFLHNPTCLDKNGNPFIKIENKKATF